MPGMFEILKQDIIIHLSCGGMGVSIIHTDSNLGNCNTWNAVSGPGVIKALYNSKLKQPMDHGDGCTDVHSYTA